MVITAGDAIPAGAAARRSLSLASQPDLFWKYDFPAITQAYAAASTGAHK